MTTPATAKRARKPATLIPQVTAMDTLCGQLRQRGLPLPQREVMLVPGRRWRVDGCYRLLGIVLEIEGAVWVQGRHTRGSGFIGDIAKYNALALLGWRLLRYTTQMVKDEIAADEIERMLTGHLRVAAQ